ncbi:MAG TPA: PIG-L family deacetylase [Firmicutes bacterium]|nr:PIG-L family deacetylase [Candidatus Fermentithermobacillaceae bacterium]
MNIKDLVPIPELRRARNVLVIFPHPDDAELVAGGTVALLTGEGATVTYAPVTDGGMGCFDPRASREEISRLRRKEQAEAAGILGVSHIEWLGFEDGRVPEPETLRKSMVSLIRRVRPDFVITLDPWLPYEAHPDHRRTAMAAVEACLFASFPLAYPEDLDKGFLPWQVTGIALALSTYPNTFINIEKTWDKKIQAILCHRSQFPEEVWNTFFPYILAKSQEYGKEIGAKVAEVFKVLSPTHLHVMVDTWRV